MNKYGKRSQLATDTKPIVGPRGLCINITLDRESAELLWRAMRARNEGTHAPAIRYALKAVYGNDIDPLNPLRPTPSLERTVEALRLSVQHLETRIALLEACNP